MSTDLRLVRQLSAGPDGLRYEGRTGDGAALTVERLFLARRHPARWSELTARLAVAARIDHPGVIQPLAAALDGDDPYLVKPLLPTLRALHDRTLEGTLALVAALADALAAGHRLGLAHGALAPSAVAIVDGRPALDLGGTRTGATGEADDFDRVCLPPEAPREPSFPGDVFALGALATSLLTGRPTASVAEADALAAEGPTRRVGRLLAEMIDPDPGARPAIQEVVARLGRAETTEVLAPESQALPPMTSRHRIGRYDLVDLLGEGGMGRVYRARDLGSGALYALKLLHDRLREDAQALKRFYREARVLAELDNDHIARFIEVNQDGDHHFLVMELIEGASLSALLERHGRLPVDLALSVVRDVARALADVHDLGVVHRDIKPGNVLLVGAGPEADLAEVSAYRVKLCDFGIATAPAAEVEEGEAELTRAGMALGTPHYMAPEQCVGAEVGPPADVYALGVTLYKLLAGVVPFNAPDARSIIYAHLRDPVPDIRGHRPDLDDEVVRLVDVMLQKPPADRFPDARALLEAMERLRRGAPESMATHLRAPDRSTRYSFVWQLRATPARLWPHVSHTERLNRAIGLGAIEFSRRLEDGTVRTHGQLKLSGMSLEWQEHPYEWIAPRRMGILREFSSGPFVWLRSTVELTPNEGGTRLTHTIEVEPRGVIGRAAAAMEIGFKTKKNLERVYRRIDEHAIGERTASIAAAETTEVIERLDPFEPPSPVTAEQLARIERGADRLRAQAVDPRVVDGLVTFLRAAPPQEVGRIRPRAFARRFGLDAQAVLHACLHGAREGLLTMLWDVICPRCQIPADIAESLAKLREAHRCEACDLDFAVDFGRSIEVVFRAHPQVRASEIGTYCIGGPGHTPHVVAQVRLAPGERFELSLELEDGSYQIAGRQVEALWPFTVRHGAPLAEWELPLRAQSEPGAPRTLSARGQRIVIVNELGREVVARIERKSGREDAITAAEAASTALFRQLFPGEVLAPGQLVAVEHLTLLCAGLVNPWANADESAAFARLSSLRAAVEAVTAEAGGAVVKIHRDGVLASFHDPLDALCAARTLARPDAGIALHTGSAMATSINDRLDYFGRVVHDLDRLLLAAGAGEVLVSEALAADPAAAPWLEAEAPAREVVVFGGLVAQRLRFTR